MAVMATPPPIDTTTFAPLDTKAQTLAQPQPVPHAAPDAMAIDAQFDGSTYRQDASLSTESATYAATNGDHSMDAINAMHTNGHSTATTTTNAAEPVSHVSSGIASTAPFLSEVNTSIDAPFDPAANISTPIIAASVEQPISDVRDEPVSIPSEPLVEQTQAMDINQEQRLTHPNTNIAQSATDLGEVDQEQDADATAGLENIPADAASLPSRPASNGPDAMAVDAPLSGHVRPREEDEEDFEPSAKRTKVDSPASETEAQASNPEPATNGAGAMAPPQSQTIALQQPRLFDSGPMTESQRKFCAEKMRTAMKTKSSFAFNQAVDPVALQIPTYLEIVKKPMDMGTMLQKLKDNEYKSVDEFISNFELMVSNSIAFNGANHPVTHAAMALKAYFFKMMDKLPKADAPPPEKKVKKLPPSKTDKPRRESRASFGHARSPSGVSPQNTFPPDPTTGMPLIRRDSSAADGRPKREIHRPPPRDLPYTSAKPKRKKFQLELKFAKMVVDNMRQKSHLDYSYPFLNPVDPVALNIPTYHKIIKKPMDLGTVNRNLKNDAYGSAKEVHADIKLVFENCYKFNPPTDAVNQMGKRYEKLFDSLWSQKDQWIAREKASEKGAGDDSAHASSDGSDDESEEADGEDEKAEKIRLLQEQVRALTASIQDIAGEPVRKKSPKQPAKKTAKAKSGPKPKKTAITLPPLAKPAKKAPKIPQYSLGQKRTISETISSFNADYMQQAVDVIRRLYPQGITEGEEMELDVEELPNEVLHELWKLVKRFQKANNHKVEDEPVDEDYEPQLNNARASGPSKPRKNKPMNAREQEAKIKALAEQLGKVQNGGSSEGSPQHMAQESSDDDDDDASESEEE